MKRKVDLQNVNMKKLFRRNQIIVTTLAVMIAVAGYLNYMGSQSDEDQGVYTAGNTSYEAGALEISDEAIVERMSGRRSGKWADRVGFCHRTGGGNGFRRTKCKPEQWTEYQSGRPDRTDRAGKSGGSYFDQRHECVRLHSQCPAKQRADPGEK